MSSIGGDRAYRDLAPQARRGLQLALFGALLVGGAMFCAPWLGPRATWSEDDAQGYADAASRFHDLQHTSSHTKPGADQKQHKGHAHDSNNGDSTTEQQLAAAKHEYEQRRHNLESALNRGQTAESVMRWSGIALAMVGLIQFLRYREAGA